MPGNCTDSSHTGNVIELGYNLSLSAGDNGNVLGVSNYKDSTRSQTFTYDSLNRLTSAQNSGTNCSATTANGKSEYWGNIYTYDPWGNLTDKTKTKCGAEDIHFNTDGQNRLHVKVGADYQYDAAGNMTYDANAALNYSYDAENRISGAGGYTYTYDDDGNRVQKSNGSSGTLYWYIAPGVVAESDPSGNLKSEYVFFTGRRIARRDSLNGTGGVFYFFSDHLKTTDIVTDAQASIKNESDFYPWGGEVQLISGDTNHYKFTGKERDAETGLDYFGARYYSNGLGRFVTPDWAAKATAVPYAELADPQSLNLYSYLRDLPTTTTDPDGHSGDCPSAIAGDPHIHHSPCDGLNRGAQIGPDHSRIPKWSKLGAVNPEGEQYLLGWGLGKLFGVVAGKILGLFGKPAEAGAGKAVRGGLGPVLKGVAGVEKAVAEIEAEGGEVLGREITIENSAGRARVDIAYRDATGELRIGDAKNGPTAGVNPNQARVYEAAKTEGAKFVGDNAEKAGLPSSIGPTEVRIFKY